MSSLFKRLFLPRSGEWAQQLAQDRDKASEVSSWDLGLPLPSGDRMPGGDQEALRRVE